MKKLILIALTLFGALGLVWAGGTKEKTSAYTPETLEVWDELSEHVAQSYSNLAETSLYQELERMTDIKAEFVHPPQGELKQGFSLMVASGDLPDVIYYSWNDYPGGPSAALQDGVILRLNELISKHAPNFYNLLEENPEWAKAIKTDDGVIYNFPFIRGDKSLLVFFGPILRKDWLDELGMAVPETIDEWENVLKAMKIKTPYPLTFVRFGEWWQRHIKNGSTFVGAYGIQMDWYQDNGRVKYGQYEPAYKDFLMLFRKWYAEGLIDPEFFVNDQKTFDAKILNDRAGAFLGYAGSNIGKYLEAMESKNPRFDLAGAKYPVLKKGDMPFTGQTSLLYENGSGAAITTDCENPALACTWLDYAYGKSGHMLFNFGIEDLSYKMINGFPTYTDEIFNNPNGLGVSQAMGKYIRANSHGPYVQDKRYITQYYRSEQQRAAWERWSQTDALEHKIPGITPTIEETQEMAGIETEIMTYADEMFIRFVTGEEPLTNFDEYRAQLKKMGIERAIEINQHALDRYNNR